MEKKFRHLILLIVIIFILPSNMNIVNGANPSPDFAYPQNVSRDARAVLQRLSSLPPEQVGPQAVKALLELTVASEAVDSDSLYAMPMEIARIAEQVNQPSDKAMLMTLEASVLSGIYQDNMWAIRQVDAPTQPIPEDIHLWSEEHYREGVNALVDSALLLVEQQPGDALNRWSACLDGNEEAFRYLPEVSDFVRYMAIQVLKPLDADRAEELLTRGIESSAPNSSQQVFWLWCRDQDNSDKLIEDYNELKDVEAARLLLATAIEARYGSYTVGSARGNNSNLQKHLNAVDLLRASLDRFPNWSGNSSLRSALARLTQPQLSYSMPDLCAPGDTVELSVGYLYPLLPISFDVYNIPSGMEVEVVEDITDNVPLLTRLSFTPDSIWGSKILKFKVEQAGKYAVIGNMGANRSKGICQFTATPLMPIVVSGTDRTAIVAADFHTGAPISGVTVIDKTSTYSGPEISRTLGNTGRNGMLVMERENNDRKRHNVLFRYNGHDFDFNNSVYIEQEHYGRDYLQQRDSRYHARIMTDRALYHPGDSVEWAAIVCSSDGPNGNVAVDCECEVTFMDSNWQQVDSLIARTDAMGRISGTFVVPKGRLTGSYNLQIKNENGYIDMTYISVSDFRLSTIYTEVTEVLRGIPNAEEVSLRGIVRTYSGMPVANARISARISGAERWWRWFAPANELGIVEGTTDASGVFNLVVPQSILAKETNQGEKYSDFIANIVATSINAETAETSRNFTTGKPIVLHSEFPEMADASKTNKAVIYAMDANCDNQAKEVEWQLGVWNSETKAMEQVVASGTAIAGTQFALNLARVDAGVYSLCTCTSDSALAEPEVSMQCITIYNSRLNKVPETADGLFLPEATYTASGNKVRVLVGVYQSQLNYFSFTRIHDKMKSYASKSLNHGFHYIEIEDDELAQYGGELLLAGVCDGKTWRTSITIKPAPKPEVKVETESFRDRINAGDREIWRFRLLNGEEPMRGAAMIATMYNGALEALQPYTTIRPFIFREPSYQFSSDYMYFGQASSRIRVRAFDQDEAFDWTLPVWKYFDELDVPSSRYGHYKYRLSATNSANTASADGEAPVLYETMEVAEDAVAYEEFVEEEVTTVNVEQEPEVKYRSAEELQAFFMPSLLADENGEVEVAFTVPNANGAWNFVAVAWDAALNMGEYNGKVVAAKPVMVQPNLPRFLRQGDCAKLGATVFNNTDVRAYITTVVELFDPNSGEIVLSKTFTSSIEAQGSELVCVDAIASTTMSALGYRVRATLGRYADGEQSAIPILPSSATVVESEQFYLNPSDSTVMLNVEVRPETSYTLQYCSNPIWTVVKAMRGLNGTQTNSSTGIVSKLYSVLAAKKIARDNAAIGDAFHQWQTQPNEEGLNSMLENNSELKTLLLDQTPWVQAAKNQTARMSALGEIFDDESVAARANSLFESLSNLQNTDGGFAWGSWFPESSVWATEVVLTTLGLANSMDMLGDKADEISAMCSRAFEFLQSCVTRPNAPQIDRDFALIKTLWQDFELSNSGVALLDRTVAAISEQWRGDTTIGKAYDVLILKAYGREAVAQAVYESIRQFGVVRAGQGLCFPSVDDTRSYATIIQAYHAMGAPVADLDAMRQWITIVAQANEDLGAYNPDYIIAAVMLTGTDWTSVPNEFGVCVNGTDLTVGEHERAMGYASIELHPTSSSLNVAITPNGITPSYGSVIAIGQQVLSEIDAHAGQGISIEKRTMVQRDGEWVETREFVLGERVRVQLIVQTNRTMQYVAITDQRSAGFEPVDQLPGFVWDGVVGMYRESNNTQTNLFVGELPAGTYHFDYDMTANNAGTFISGIATLQSQYDPGLTAHSSGCTITIKQTND